MATATQQHTEPQSPLIGRKGTVSAHQFKKALESAAVQPHTPTEGNRPGMLVVPGLDTGMIAYVDKRYYVVSVYPEPRKHVIRQGDVRNGGAGITTYYMPAAKRGEYQIVEVAPTIYWKHDFSGGLDDAPSDQRIPVPTSAFENAKALVDEWARGSTVMSGAPGFGVVPEGVEEGTEEFYEFLQQLIKQQEAFFQAAIDMADAAYRRGDKIQNISRAVAGAEWLYGDKANQYPWFGRKKFEIQKSCPACSESIAATATRCVKCQCNLLDFYKGLGVSAEGNDPVVHLYEVCVTEYKRIPTAGMIDRVVSGEPVFDVAVEFATTTKEQTSVVAEKKLIPPQRK